MSATADQIRSLFPEISDISDSGLQDIADTEVLNPSRGIPHQPKA